jgi:hypothetical protein
MQRVRGRQHGDDDARPGGDCGRRADDVDSGARRIGAPGRIDVVADHAPAGLDEKARECASHDAEADDSDGLVHVIHPGKWQPQRADCGIQARFAIRASPRPRAAPSGAGVRNDHL